MSMGMRDKSISIFLKIQLKTKLLKIYKAKGN